MELDPPGVVVQEVAEVLVEVEGVLEGWEITDPGLDPVGSVFALIAERDYHIS